MSKTTPFLIKFPTDDLDTIKGRASDAGLTASEYIRKMSLHGLVLKYNTRELDHVVWELNKIGVNIKELFV